MKNKTDGWSELVVLGGGPGGYAAAFAAADRGMDVTLVDDGPNPGGVCLFRGCIPSKALLHVARVLREAGDAAEFGVEFAKPRIDVDRMRTWKDEIVGKLAAGVGELCKARKVRHLKARGRFVASDALEFGLLNGAEQLHLHLVRDLADLVEE